MPRSKAFREILVGTQDTYLGRRVPIRFQRKYGKRYDLNETKAIAYAVANKIGIQKHQK